MKSGQHSSSTSRLVTFFRILKQWKCQMTQVKYDIPNILMWSNYTDLQVYIIITCKQSIELVWPPFTTLDKRKTFATIFWQSDWNVPLISSKYKGTPKHEFPDFVAVEWIPASSSGMDLVHYKNNGKLESVPRTLGQALHVPTEIDRHVFSSLLNRLFFLDNYKLSLVGQFCFTT